MAHRKTHRTATCSALVLVAAQLVACGNCDDEIEAAGTFLHDRNHLACEADDDCVVVLTGCHTFEDLGACGQAQLNRTASASAEWSRLQGDLRDCDDSCETCTLALLPGCNDGFCGGSP
jgi:hypothetical protein